MFDKRFIVTHNQRNDGSWMTYVNDTKRQSGSGISGFILEPVAIQMVKIARERMGVR